MNDITKLKLIKELGAGVFGTAYLVNKDNQKYALKIQHILPKYRNKSYNYELWRELDFFEFIDTLNNNDSKFFMKLYIYNIHNKCSHKQIRNFNLDNKDTWHRFLEKLDKSEWCISYLLEYKGKNTLYDYISKHSITHNETCSFILQLVKISYILYKGGYSHNDIHSGNIMVNKTNDKYFLLNKKKIPYYGIQLSLIDYGRVLHNKFNILKKDDEIIYSLLESFKEDSKQYIFNDIIRIIYDIIFNMEKYYYNCEKQNKTKPWKQINDPLNNLIKKIILNHTEFWKNAKLKYLQIYPETIKLLNIIETSDKDIYDTIDEYNEIENYSKNIWNVLNRISREFIIYSPKLYKKYYGWCSYHKPNLEKNYIIDILKITTLDKLKNYMLKIIK